MSNTSPSLSGYFKLVAVDSVTGKVRHLAKFQNLILNAGLEAMGTAGVISTCFVGAGSTAPTNADTALQSSVASTTTIQATSKGAQTTAPYFGWRRWTFRFGAGAAAGNLSEVGIGTGTVLFSRSLIKDSGGTPTTITVLSTEFLDVTYELRLNAPTTDVTTTVTIAGVTHTMVMRPALVTNPDYWEPRIASLAAQFIDPFSGRTVTASNGALGDATASPSGTQLAGSVTPAAYSSGSKTATAALTWALDEGNAAGGISAIYFTTNIGAYQISFSPAIAKNNTKTLSLTGAVSWARGA